MMSQPDDVKVYPIVSTQSVCALNKRTLRSLDFSFNRFFTKLFKTTDVEIIKACQEMYYSELPSVQLIERHNKFIVLNGHCG